MDRRGDDRRTRSATVGRSGGRRALWLSLLCGASVGLMGCQLLSLGTSPFSQSAARTFLPTLQAGRDAIQLEFMVVERPDSDPLLGSALWREVDQVCGVPTETRLTLRDNGLRLGHVGSNPPAALQTLLAVPKSTTPSVDEVPRARHLALRSGSPAEIHASPVLEQFDCAIVREGRHETLQGEHGRCVLRVTPVRVQEGWIRLDFLPEIHHGQRHLRREGTHDGHLENQVGQSVICRHDLQFSVTLNQGEIAVVGDDGEAADSLGALFFRSTTDANPVRRVFIVRLADAGREYLKPEVTQDP